MFPQIVLTDAAVLVMRLGLAAVFYVHGTAKIPMWKMKPSDQLKKPMLYVLRLLAVCEPLGAAAMVLGFLTRWAALGFFIIMLGAMNLKIRMVGKKFSEGNVVGWEFEFIIAAAALALALLGGGHWSADAWLLKM